MPTPPRATLTRETVLKAALQLLDEAGLDAVTTRKLAERLDVQSPALYWHFKNKGELFEEMAAHMMLELNSTEHPTAKQNWAAWLTEHARAFRRMLLSYRDGARLHASSTPSPDQFQNIEAHARLLCAAGFTPPDAIRALMAVGRYVVGWVLEEQAGEKGSRPHPPSLRKLDANAYPLLAQAMSGLRDDSPDTGFDFGLQAMISGFAKEIHRKKESPTRKRFGPT